MTYMTEKMRRKEAGLPPPCMEFSERPSTLAVYPTDGEKVGLSWSRFVSVRLRGDAITLKFVEDEVVVHGHNLSSVFEFALRLGIECLRTIPATYRPVLDDSEVVITEIEVRPVKY
jgi:hypothetical protein